LGASGHQTAGRQLDANARCMTVIGGCSPASTAHRRAAGIGPPSLTPSVAAPGTAAVNGHAGKPEE